MYAKRRRLHARVVNVRNDNNHKATTGIVKSVGRVVVETLNIAGMLRDLYLNRDHAEFAVCLTDSPEWATELEDRLIKHYQPVHNRIRLG